MTQLSHYLAVEEVDPTEPAEFYAPGVRSIHDPRYGACRRAIAVLHPADRVYPALDYSHAGAEIWES